MGDPSLCFWHQVLRIRGTKLMFTNFRCSEALLSVLLWFSTPPYLEPIYFWKLLIRIFKYTHKWQELKTAKWFSMIQKSSMQLMTLVRSAIKFWIRRKKVAKWVNWQCGKDETAWFFSSSFSSKTQVQSCPSRQSIWFLTCWEGP